MVDLAATAEGRQRLIHDVREYYREATEELSKTFVQRVSSMVTPALTERDLGFIEGAVYMLRQITLLTERGILDRANRSNGGGL